MLGIPDQHHWTLRFKQHKTTVLLFVTQGQSFTSIKADLLEAIRATGVREINGKGLPTKSDDIILGVPIDKNDFSKGWVNLEIPELEGDETGSKSKGVRKNSVLNASPLGAGLKEGSVLAFRFKKVSGEDEISTDDNDFDVIMPSYEEDTGME